MFSSFNPGRAFDGADAFKGVKEVSDAFGKGNLADKGFATAKLGATFMGFFSGKLGLVGSIVSMNLNAAEAMRKPSMSGFVNLGFDVAKIATTPFPVANLAVRGVEVTKDAFVHCANNPEEFSKFLRTPLAHPDSFGFNQ
jgi:hypothetical protein